MISGLDAHFVDIDKYVADAIQETESERKKRKKTFEAYSSLKKRADIAPTKQLLQAVTIKILNYMQERVQFYLEDFQFLTLTNAQNIPIQSILEKGRLVKQIIAQEFFYAYKATSDDTYKKIAKDVYEHIYKTDQLAETDLGFFVNILREGTTEDKALAKKLLQPQDNDGSRDAYYMKYMKVCLYADILYRDENNPQEAVRYVEEELSKAGNCSSYYDSFQVLMLYYLSKLQPFPKERILAILELRKEEPWVHCYYTYLIEKEETQTIFPHKNTIEEFKKISYFKPRFQFIMSSLAPFPEQAFRRFYKSFLVDEQKSAPKLLGNCSSNGPFDSKTYAVFAGYAGVSLSLQKIEELSDEIKIKAGIEL